MRQSAAGQSSKCVGKVSAGSVRLACEIICYGPTFPAVCHSITALVIKTTAVVVCIGPSVMFLHDCSAGGAFIHIKDIQPAVVFRPYKVKSVGSGVQKKYKPMSFDVAEKWVYLLRCAAWCAESTLDAAGASPHACVGLISSDHRV